MESQEPIFFDQFRPNHRHKKYKSQSEIFVKSVFLSNENRQDLAWFSIYSIFATIWASNIFYRVESGKFFSFAFSQQFWGSGCYDLHASFATLISDPAQPGLYLYEGFGYKTYTKSDAGSALVDTFKLVVETSYFVSSHFHHIATKGCSRCGDPIAQILTRASDFEGLEHFPQWVPKYEFWVQKVDKIGF